MNEIEKVYEIIIENLNQDEKKYSGLYIYTSNGFTEYKKYYGKKTFIRSKN